MRRHAETRRRKRSQRKPPRYGLKRTSRLLPCATSGQLQLPVGMTYDKADPQLKRFSEWSNATGAIIHAWHSQSWALHMFNVSSHDPESGSMDFAAGGWQGGRNWCSCAQCSYAAPWCDTENGDDRLISGSWFVENVKEELDQVSDSKRTL